MKVGIIGASGYGGLELVRLLHTHPEVESVELFTSSEEGTVYSHKYTHLYNIMDQPLRRINAEEMSSLDVVFSSAPAGVASTLLPPLIGKGPRIIDLSGDFRLKDEELYRNWYQKDPAPGKYLQESVYGLTEWNRSAIEKATLIANPGCYPTAVLLSLLPLLRDQLIDGSQLIIDAKSGVSGAGNTPSQMTHFSETNENISIYKVNKHQHIPEIEQGFQLFAKEQSPITFSTHLVPMTRGIIATSYARLEDGVSQEKLIECLTETYNESPFVRIIPASQKFGTKQVSGSNYCDIQVYADSRTNRVTVVSVIDNLVKGAAGQAIQNMNVQFGLKETTGLTQVPAFI
ncbi:N-acetyl-gamma-glutamyl-phosphate reductase [Jeotgalibacillus soli]|uniref:N-acetyl-gamma-glutamyl-phosphate reductase n=1 Tax=Jeotgalibacillus soli TaxID=889306 RepID=A0A0C2VYV7_9BACL|nr:N-acetyl-gamma-glutamyl-phosphate reductase [Jeotgalibacillus soli]KIL49571.1 N-acetyl-gamma-glutamyl-phosphate reductase [Jeotgalibacillus soli]